MARIRAPNDSGSRKRKRVVTRASAVVSAHPSPASRSGKSVLSKSARIRSPRSVPVYGVADRW